MTKPKMLTTAQLADSFDVTQQRVRQWVAEGRLKPSLTLPSGVHLFSANTKRPAPLKRGPKPSK